MSVVPFQLMVQVEEPAPLPEGGLGAAGIALTPARSARPRNLEESMAKIMATVVEERGESRRDYRGEEGDEENRIETQRVAFLYLVETRGQKIERYTSRCQDVLTPATITNSVRTQTTKMSKCVVPSIIFTNRPAGLVPSRKQTNNRLECYRHQTGLNQC